ncbi:MAG: putative Calcium/calmodulin-dependent protein kinase type 1 [Streblomastix strix]|uniref:Putative Calcium/calmodulin-dependent protein kinase type 1 n=1 Tax=Streblomastix strix TaxID=222440 RepID=A0A5J4W0P2_9EUKA|nr:MAG: putative Calcium/calmodulin-dependent protein kinase type 1 [Streblomastix strix]
MAIKLLDGVPSNLFENYEVMEQLGEGHFAKVKKAKNKHSGQLVAIKFIDKNQIVSDEHQLESLFSEISIMQSMKHPHIVHLYEVYETNDKLCLVMELVTGGELFDKISEHGAYTERDTSLLMHALFNAVKYMHDRGIAHRDLKPENILYESNAPGAPVKISDFGLSKVVDKKRMMSTCCGTPGYVAPEVLSYTGYGPEVDMWSLGVLMYVLLCGFPPFYDDNDAVLFQIIQKGEFEFISPYWDTISASAKDLISKLLIVDPKKRYNVNQSLKHPWFSEALPTHKLDAAHQNLKESRGKRAFKAAGLAVIVGNKSKKVLPVSQPKK